MLKQKLAVMQLYTLQLLTFIHTLLQCLARYHSEMVSEPRGASSENAELFIDVLQLRAVVRAIDIYCT